MRKRQLISVVFLVVMTTFGFAQWQKMDPRFQDSEMRVFSSGTFVVAASSAEGAFLSSDGGKTWKVLGELKKLQVTSFLAQDQNLFLGTAEQGVYRSLNGVSWRPVNNGLSSLEITTLAAVGKDLFAGTSSKGVFRFSGNSWRPVSKGLRNPEEAASAEFDVSSLAVVGTTLFAGTEAGLFSSSNEGEVWNERNQGFTIHDPNVTDPGSSYVNPRIVNNGKHLFATCMMGGSGGGVLFSDDLGLNWRAINEGLTHLIVRDLAVTDSALFAVTTQGDLCLSVNEGVVWNSIAFTKADEVAAVSVAICGEQVFVGLDDGTLYRCLVSSLQKKFPSNP